MSRFRAGFTLIELLVAMALLVVVLGIVGVYFARQAALTRDTQARTQVQDAARSAMQIVTNDLLAAGSNQYYPSGATAVTAVSLNGAIPTGTDGGLTDSVTLEYVSSLRPTLSSACRHVVYRVVSGQLERSDVACGATNSFSVLADHVLAFNLDYMCSNGQMAATPGDCPANTYVRSVKVGLMLSSNGPVHGAGPATSYTAPTPDLPTGVSGGGTVPCPAGHVCVALTQDVQTPSLKQYAPGG